MNNSSEKIKSFTDLNAWKESHKLVLMIYKITKNFPKEEMFGLTSQTRKTAVSVISNIAEGFSRQSYKEKIQFYFIAQGSLTEIQSQLLIARDLNYINKQDFNNVADQAIIAHKLLCGLIKKSKDISTHNSQFTIHNSNNKNGFTLLELTIVMAIISIMSIIVIVGYSSQRDSKALSLGESQIINDIRIAQGKSYNILSINGTSFPEGGYGIRFTEDSNKYLIFADNDNNRIYTNMTENYEEVELPKNVKISCLEKGSGCLGSGGFADIVFQPPYGKVFIDGDEKTIAGDFINLEIEIKNQGGSTKTIETSSSRLIK
ncbi:MAG: four helix bundle protein [Patescibacteria group bacterium]|nr:four helix bundle protein [Patescibacteria group bacterium]